MARERYPGERRGLSLFLDDLRSCAADVCGPASLLVHAIRRALHTGDLDHLRHARTLFNHLPRDQRQALSAACVTPAVERRPRTHELLDRYSDREPEPFVSFERRGEGDEAACTEVTLTHELLPASGVRVMVRPGTLPSTAVSDLRRIAGLIESDRRLLSERYWRGRDEDRSCDPAGQAPNSSS